MPGSGDTSSYEHPDMEAGTQTWFSWKNVCALKC